mmetsp:Transcript_3334/g.5539  ORF Transcript_3334/g.5539 Transcript_3334/m.5539 type:complete len:193 (+) Transcript_3334:1384-1962(+)
MAGLDVLKESTDKAIVAKLTEEGKVLCTVPVSQPLLRVVKSGERILSTTLKSWFLGLDDQFKMRCLEALSDCVYFPSLNLKETEQLQKEQKELKQKQRRQLLETEGIDSNYFNIVEEITDFHDWCISDTNAWGLPIPFFKDKQTEKIVVDLEIIEHFASLVELHGSSDIWYTFDVVDLLPPKLKSRAADLEK